MTDDNVTPFMPRLMARIAETIAADASMDRMHLAIPIIADAIQRMRAAGLANKEMATLLRQAADEVAA
jgi:hypothetical protein